MASTNVWQDEDVDRENMELELGNVNRSFVDDDVMEYVIHMQADTPDTVTDSRYDNDISHCRSTSDSVDMVKDIADLRNTCTASSVYSIQTDQSAHNDPGQTPNDPIDTGRCGTVSDSRTDELSVCVLPDDYARVVNDADATVNSSSCTINTASHCLTTADEADAAANSDLPPYSASVTSGPPVIRQQPSTYRLPLRRHRKYCAKRCLHCVVMATSLRFLLGAVALLGAGCVAAGIALGGLSMRVGNDYFTFSVVFIGE